MEKLIKRIIAFFVIILITTTLITFYVIAGSDDVESVAANYNPLPSVQPSFLPESSMVGDIPVCLASPTLCDSAGECQCGSYSDVTCSDVTNFVPSGDHSNSLYQFGSVSIPDDGNSYCIPKDAANLPCNQYTGKYVWTDDAAGQRWKCECKYPDLYNDPETGCTTQVACRNDEGVAITGDYVSQSTNKLALATSLVNGQKPIYWNPNDSSESTELRNSPYSVLTQSDIDNVSGDLKSLFKVGDPKYVCACGVSKDGDVIDTLPPYTRLPNDPYNCHVDSCNSLEGDVNRSLITNDDINKIPGCGKNNEPSAECSCEIGNTGLCNDAGFAVKFGDYKGLCYPPELQCQEINVDSSQKFGSYNVSDKDIGPEGTCNCPNGGTNRMCISNHVSVDQIPSRFKTDPDPPSELWACSNDSDCLVGECDTSVKHPTQKGGVCKCLNPDNVVGAECVSPCDPNPCQNNTQCTTSGEGPNMNYTCNCTNNSDGTAKPSILSQGELIEMVEAGEQLPDGIFELPGRLDCGGKQMFGYWGNNEESNTKLCTDVFSVPGTLIAQVPFGCAFGFNVGEPFFDNFIQNDHRSLNYGACNNIDYRSTGLEKVDFWNRVDYVTRNSRDKLIGVTNGQGVFCANKPRLDDSHGKCGFLGFANKHYNYIC